MAAVDDLNTAVQTMTDAVNSAVTEIQNAHVEDNSPAVAEAVGKLNDLAESLKGAVASAQTPTVNPS